MTTGSNGIGDPEALAAFLDESEELLRQVDVGLITLESEPRDPDTINAIFRAIHGIKGNSPFFGLLLVKRLAHQMEDLLALMREQAVHAGRAEISSLLGGLDWLGRMLRNVRAGQPELSAGESSAFDAALDSLQALAIGRGQVPEAAAALEPLDELEQLLQPTFDEVLPAAAAERVRQLLLEARESPSEPARAVAERALGEHDALLAAVGFVPLLRETLLERVAEMRAVAPAEAPDGIDAGGRAAASPTGPPERARAGRDKGEVSRTMRVEEAKIDEFLDYVGELIITREMFANVGKRLRSLDQPGLSTEFQRAMGAFTALSHNLQRSIMEVRKVPVKLVLQKVPRLVRDVADRAGKRAVVTLLGSDISVDKSLIESFEAPLLHMLRNAVDHGVETVEERLRRNKPPAGAIEVSVRETSAELICAISDDGCGIDVEALRKKAVQLGLLTERAAEQLSREEAHQLIFAAGLSTARQVTEVSGRGVGMDVVKRNVTELGGRIEIESEPGRGSTFTIYLPKAVTVQILDGFLVQVGQERLVLPLRAISESFRPTPDQLHTIAERGECVSRRGRVFPLVRFNRLLALGAADRCPSEAIVVSVEVSGGRPAGLLVDQVLGVQQVVLREVQGIDTRDHVFAGGAVLGDGRVAMVVDVEKLGALVARVAQA